MRSVDNDVGGREDSAPEIIYRCEADVFASAEGSIWRRPILRGRADSPGTLAQLVEAPRGAGWGYSIVTSASSVPVIAFYWQMGAGETDVSQYHYAEKKFVSVTPYPAKCGGENDRRGICAGRFSEHRLWSITPAQYDLLMQRVNAEPKSSTAALRRTFADQAHALDFPLVNDKIARVVGIASCTPHSNCTISIYGCKQTYQQTGSHVQVEADIPRCEYWPMLQGVSGWGVANVSDWTTDPLSPRVAFVIAQGPSAREVELKRYSIASEATGPQPGTVLVLDSCEIVSPRTGN